MRNPTHLLRLFLMPFAILILFSFTGCNMTPHEPGPDSYEKKGLVMQINNYYDNLSTGHPIDIGGTLLTLEENKTNLNSGALGYYLLQTGYSVTRLGEPRYISYEEPYAVYEASVKVNYPEVFTQKMGSAKREEYIYTEKIWIDTNTYKIHKIVSDDYFINARILVP